MSLTVLETPLTVIETLDSIDEARKEMNEWDCGPMTISVAESLAGGTMKSINFTDTLGHRKKIPKSDKRSNANCCWLHPEWGENTKTFRAEVITPHFVLMVQEAGVKINGGWDGTTSSIVFKCI